MQPVCLRVIIVGLAVEARTRLGTHGPGIKKPIAVVKNSNEPVAAPRLRRMRGRIKIPKSAGGGGKVTYCRALKITRQQTTGVRETPNNNYI
jgi:hypothetical protein